METQTPVASNAEPHLAWLHLSDLHLCKERAFDQNVVLRSLVKAVRTHCDQGTYKPDLIFVTGDIAFSGGADEYEAATEFLDELLMACELTKNSLFVVPGNHDVDRGRGRGLTRTLSSEAESVDYFSDDHPRYHFAKFDEFEKWYSQYFRSARPWVPFRTCQPPTIVNARGIRVAILCANTALFSQDDHDYGKLWLGRRNQDAALEELSTESYDFSILLVHHPFDWLNERERAAIRSRFVNSVDFVLHGHLHEFEAAAVVGQLSGAISLAAGAAYQTRDYPNTATFAKIQMESRTLQLYPIRYEDTPQIWTVDPSVFPTASGYAGVLELPGRINVDDAVTNDDRCRVLRLPGFHLGTVVPPRFFVSRNKELSDAQELITFRQSFLVVGSRRAGKTSLISKLMATVKEQNLSTPTNRVIVGYLNLERDIRATVTTFLEHTMINMLAETARQVFGKRFIDLASADESHEAAKDASFATLKEVYRCVLARSANGRMASETAIIPDDFVEYSKDLVDIVRSKGWHGFLVFYDEANHLPQDLSIEILLGNAEALNAENLTTVFAASPEMAKAFDVLHDTFPRRIDVGPFKSPDDLKDLLATYYFAGDSATATIPITKRALDRVWSLSQQYPYQIQCLLWYSFSIARDSGVSEVRREDVDRAFELLAKSQPEYFSDRQS